MNYYLFCYHSRSDAPDLSEAQEVVEQRSLSGLPGGSLSELARLLMEYNPGLVQFAIKGPDQSAKQPSAEKTITSRHILLIEKQGKVSPRINIYSDNVSLEVPLISSPALADQVISRIMAYVRIICAQTGYFVYDPQTVQACDPSGSYISGLKAYLFTAQQLIKK